MKGITAMLLVNNQGALRPPVKISTMLKLFPNRLEVWVNNSEADFF
jgi:hypothetical protein